MSDSDDRKQPKQPAQQPRQQEQRGDPDKQYGEGNYQASRDYDRGLKEHLRTHDVEREARDAAPRSDEEAREMEQAEDLGKRKAEGMKDPKDQMDDSGRDGKAGPSR
jgi:hypothetical protein